MEAAGMLKDDFPLSHPEKEDYLFLIFTQKRSVAERRDSHPASLSLRGSYFSTVSGTAFRISAIVVRSRPAR